jgi:hypothetical protein
LAGSLRFSDRAILTDGGFAMTALDEFLDDVVPRIVGADTALHVLRRECGAWKAVHRHGDHGPERSLTWLVEDP